MHLTTEDRKTVSEIADRCGLPELIRVVASLTANSVDGIADADDLRGDLFDVASRIESIRRDVVKATEALNRNSLYALQAATDGNLDAATRADILRSAIAGNESDALSEHVCDHTAKMRKALHTLTGE